jgi:ABC-type thiamine transport system substrate-binding protein
MKGTFHLRHQQDYTNFQAFLSSQMNNFKPLMMAPPPVADPVQERFTNDPGLLDDDTAGVDISYSEEAQAKPPKTLREEIEETAFGPEARPATDDPTNVDPPWISKPKAKRI